MTFLQLVQKLQRLLRIEQSALGSTPTTVVGQTGVLGELVHFIADSWTDIQNDNAHWLFMQKRGTLALPVSNINVAFTSIADFETLILSDADGRGRFITMYRDSVADEQIVRYIPYQDWQQSYLQRGDRGSGMPALFTVLPDGRLEFDLTADDDYTLRFDYRRTAQALAADGDEPIVAARYHNAIVWWAINRYYCTTRSETGAFFNTSARELKREMQKLINEQTPEILGIEVRP